MSFMEIKRFVNSGNTPLNTVIKDEVGKVGSVVREIGTSRKKLLYTTDSTSYSSYGTTFCIDRDKNIIRLCSHYNSSTYKSDYYLYKYSQDGYAYFLDLLMYQTTNSISVTFVYDDDNNVLYVFNYDSSNYSAFKKVNLTTNAVETLSLDTIFGDTFTRYSTSVYAYYYDGYLYFESISTDTSDKTSYFHRYDVDTGELVLVASITTASSSGVNRSLFTFAIVNDNIYAIYSNSRQYLFIMNLKQTLPVVARFTQIKDLKIATYDGNGYVSTPREYQAYKLHVYRNKLYTMAMNQYTYSSTTYTNYGLFEIETRRSRMSAQYIYGVTTSTLNSSNPYYWFDYSVLWGSGLYVTGSGFPGIFKVLDLDMENSSYSTNQHFRYTDNYDIVETTYLRKGELVECNKRHTFVYYDDTGELLQRVDNGYVATRDGYVYIDGSFIYNIR